MGQGIAQVAVMHGHPVRILDIDRATAQAGIDGIRKRLNRLVEKGRLTAAQCREYSNALVPADGPADLSDCNFIIEAVSESLDVKTAVLSQVKRVIGPDAVIATNTSSLSVAQLGRMIGETTCTLGLHFFNPVPLQPLVELISTHDTNREAVSKAHSLATSWSKVVVRSADSPGFIVNRVARPFYLEAWRTLEEGLGTVDQIDHTMREIAGFPMGPFQLMDYLGHDLSLDVTDTVYNGLGRPLRFRPSDMQRYLVASGRLGKKTGRGAYEYAHHPPLPSLNVEPTPLSLRADTLAVLDRFVSRAVKNPPESMIARYVFARILSAIINEACHAIDDEVATPEDINTAMRLGTKYPLGPFDWMQQIEPELCIAWLNELTTHTGTGRYTPAPFLLTLTRT